MPVGDTTYPTYAKRLGRRAQLGFDLSIPRIDWSVLDWNETAIGFYRSIGAVPMDGWTGYRLTGEALAALGTASQQEE